MQPKHRLKDLDSSMIPATAFTHQYPINHHRHFTQDTLEEMTSSPLFHSPAKAQTTMTTSEGDLHVADRYFLELYESNDVDLVELILTSFSSVAIPSRPQSSRSSTCPAQGYEYIYTQPHCGRATIVRSHHIQPRSPCRNLIEAGPQRILKGIYQIEQPRSP